MKSSDILKLFIRKCCRCHQKNSYNLIIQSKILKRNKRICLNCFMKENKKADGG